MLVLIGGVFFVAVISLYHMLELMQKTDFGMENGLPGRQVDEVRPVCEIPFILLIVTQYCFKEVHYSTGLRTTGTSLVASGLRYGYATIFLSNWQLWTGV